MSTLRIRARHYATGELIDVVCGGEQIESVELPASGAADLTAAWVAPSLFDLQINGCDGRSFNSARLDIASVVHVVRVCQRHGIGGLCPTLVTNDFDALRHGLTTLRGACETEDEVARAVPGFHLEGPYISPEDGPRGAHPQEHVRPPDWDEFCRFQEAAAGRIRLVTLAPEHDGALDFIERLTSTGVVVAIGHTSASGPRIRDAIRAGARLSTHLGNGCHALLPRHDNCIWEQLAADELWASLICDGHHLPASVARSMIRVKTPSRTILTCDASSLAGLAPGRYAEWGQEFEVLPHGKVIVAGTNYLAGSGVFTDACVRWVVRNANVRLADALDMAGAQTRQLLSLPPVRLEPGQQADLVLFDAQPGDEFRPRALLTGGRLVWQGFDNSPRAV